jgi:monofunctional biosynthetic peptidoglycan transglycosylase
MMKKYLKYIALFLIAAFGFSIFSVLFYKFVPVPLTPLMVIKKISNGYEIKHDWVSLSEISKHMIRSVVRAEDAKFYNHFGFDFEAIKKAQEYNKRHKKTKGASTISQQTAKNVFLYPARSYIRKGLEAYFTVLIELFWSKDRIMEVYLNVIELGPGIYGVEAAGQKFFKKSAKKLTMNEAALLAAVLPNPIKFKVNKPSAYVLKRRSRIMGRMLQPEKPKELENSKDLQDFLDIKFDEEEEKEEAKTETEATSTPSSASSIESETKAQ